MARTGYLINGPQDMTVLLTAAKRNRQEGRVIAVRTRDGGRNWNFQSYMGPEPLDYTIMPSSVRLGPASIVTAVRRRNWIAVYRSNDNGDSWTRLNQAATDIGGNPPSLVHMPDGRLLMTYGYRKEPYGIRARFSSDEGLTWGATRSSCAKTAAAATLATPAPSCGPTANLSPSTTTMSTPPTNASSPPQSGTSTPSANWSAGGISANFCRLNRSLQHKRQSALLGFQTPGFVWAAR